MTTAKAITTTFVHDQYVRRTVFRALMIALVVLSLAYVYFIGSITFNVLARKSLENTMRETGSRVSNLELSYMNLSNSLDKNFALAHGFVDAHNTLFATRTTARVAIR